MALGDAWTFLKYSTEHSSAKEPTFWESLDEHERKTPLQFMSPAELNELIVYGQRMKEGDETDFFDPDTVEYYLGRRTPLTEEELRYLDDNFRSIELQQEQGEASHPEGISHPDNVRQYEEETGSKAKNWGLGPPVHIEGNILGQAVDHTFNAEGETVNPDTQRRTTAGDTVRPQVIGNMAWPWASREGRDFTSTNKAEMS